MLIPQKAEFNLTNQYYETIAKAQNYIYILYATKLPLLSNYN